MHGVTFNYYKPHSFGLGFTFGGNLEAAPSVWDTYPTNFFWHERRKENDIKTGWYAQLGSNYTVPLSRDAYVSIDFGGTWAATHTYEGWYTPTGVWGYEGNYYHDGEKTNTFGGYAGASLHWKHLNLGAKYDTALKSVFGTVGYVF